MSANEFSSTKGKWTINQDSFDRLLAWLDDDRDQAGLRYEDIRIRLIKIFVRRGCNVAEELADETIDRVARKIMEIESIYVGDRALYFYGVAGNVFLEHVKRKPDPIPPPAPDPPEVVEANHRCLEECMERLTTRNHEFILQYYREERKAKIDNRKSLADRLGVSVNTLRMRAYRIKLTLQECVMECLGRVEN
jgi:DNA-directed RNA polymerase specialized sigma24 family protein